MFLSFIHLLRSFDINSNPYFSVVAFWRDYAKIYSAQKTLAFCRFAARAFICCAKSLGRFCSAGTFYYFLNKHFTRKNHNISVDELSQALELTDKAELSEENNIKYHSLWR